MDDVADEPETWDRSDALADCDQFVVHCDLDTTADDIAVRDAPRQLLPTIVIGHSPAVVRAPPK